MVVLQDRDVVVEVGELGVGVAKEGTEKEWTSDTLSFVSFNIGHFNRKEGMNGLILDWHILISRDHGPTCFCRDD